MPDAKCSVLINAANLHSGGGVQVASSFIVELLALDVPDLELFVLISNEIGQELFKLNVDLTSLKNIKIANTFGLKAVWSPINKYLANYDLVFTVFGPNYLKNKGYIDLVGFAQAWIIDSAAYEVLSPLSKIKAKIKFLVQEWFFRRSDAFVVELEHVRDGLYHNKIAKIGAVHVAHNCISSLYLDCTQWRRVELGVSNMNFRIGFLGRDYPHKNTQIIPRVKEVLLERHGLAVDFFVTFNESEWRAKSEEFRQLVNNLGSLSVTECPSFYLSMDAVIFPSILECFSATPLESMVMEKPLFASDRRFVKDVCGGYAFYFDPFDAEDAANIIAGYIENQYGRDAIRLQQAKEHAINFSNARSRAEQYLSVIRALLSERP